MITISEKYREKLEDKLIEIRPLEPSGQVLEKIENEVLEDTLREHYRSKKAEAQ